MRSSPSLDIDAIYKAIKIKNLDQLKQLVGDRKSLPYGTFYSHYGLRMDINLMSFADALDVPNDMMKFLLDRFDHPEVGAYTYSSSIIFGDRFAVKPYSMTIGAIFEKKWDYVRLYINNGRLDLDHKGHDYTIPQKDRSTFQELLLIHEAPKDIIELAKKLKLEHLKQKAQGHFNDHEELLKRAERKKCLAEKAIQTAEQYAEKTQQAYRKPTLKKFGQ